jgi:predicted glycoside hydrolase/deacetylase ChbG (UPF0249 family)
VLQLLNFILAQFGERENHFFRDHDKIKAFEQIQPFVKDICYNCIIILRSQESADRGDEIYSNQANVMVPKFGIHRIRAIEQLRLACLSSTKTIGLKQSGVISTVLRRKIIETILYLIRNYAFCSTSH